MITLRLVACTLGALMLGCESQQDSLQLTSMIDSVSYGVGINIGRSIKRDSLDLNADFIARGIRDVLRNEVPMISDAEMQKCMAEYEKMMMAKQQVAMTAQIDENKKQGAEFLAENKKSKEITALESGLQYKVIKMGKGKKPQPTNTVKVHYRGTLINGTEFDSSVKRGQPAEFQLNSVIRGWTEGLQLMPAGSKWILYIPSDLAYGDSPAGSIPPGATLIFEVELLEVK